MPHFVRRFSAVLIVLGLERRRCRSARSPCASIPGPTSPSAADQAARHLLTFVESSAVPRPSEVQ
jgi:hypothetical protein